jgi:hypothetical protein
MIGRQPDCEIVIDDPAISRRHAHVRPTQDGAEIVPLGRTPLDVNGTPVTKPRALADGDELRFPGLVLTVMLRDETDSPAAATGYGLDHTGGASFGVVTSPFSIGGGANDDLIVAAWPDGAIELRVAQGELFVAPRVAGVAVFERALEPDEPVALVEGDVLGFAGETFTVRYFGGAAATTKVKRGELPSHVVIEILPRGGKIVFTTSTREYEVLLADRRLDLLMALLRPPAGHATGDWIPDDVVRAVVWPRNPAVSRPEINTLISRCRRDLVGAGLAGPRLIERSPGGGATRIALAPGATVEVRG